MATTLYISREKWNERCIIPYMNNLNIKNFITRLQPEKLQWSLTTKQCKKFLYLCSFCWATQHRLIPLLCWDQRHPYLFSEYFCATCLVISHVQTRWFCIITLQDWVRNTGKILPFKKKKKYELSYLDLRMKFVLILQWWILMEPDQLKFSGQHWQTCCPSLYFYKFSLLLTFY